MYSIRFRISVLRAARSRASVSFSRFSSNVSGSLYVSGSSSTGQLGIESMKSTKAGPEHVPLPEPVSHVALGAFHALAVGSSGALYGWGGGESGQNGHGFKTQVDKPKLIKGVADVRFTSVAAGKLHSLALSACVPPSATFFRGVLLPFRLETGQRFLRTPSCITDISPAATAKCMHGDLAAPTLTLQGFSAAKGCWALAVPAAPRRPSSCPGFPSYAL